MQLNYVIKHVLLAAVICGSSELCFADLDEEGFANYQEGELLGQYDWHPQCINEAGTYVDTMGRGFLRRDAATKEQSLVWLAGFKDRDQTRILKSFPETTGEKVVVKMQFLPGGTYLGGQIAFNGGSENGFAIRCIRGTLNVSVPGAPLKDTGLKFKPKDWNSLEMQLDFAAKKLEVFLNGQWGGEFAISQTLDHLSQLNMYAGGGEFESAMKNIVIKSVDTFNAAPKTNTSPK